MPRPRPPYLHCERNRHGDRVWYVRRHHGPRIRLRAEYASPEFWAEYRAALEGAPPVATKAKPHTLAWAIDKYRASSGWGALAPSTRRARENIYRKVIETAGAEPLSAIDQQAILDGRERRKAAPHSANVFIKALRTFFRWAASEEGNHLADSDPTEGVALLKGKNDKIGFHPWSEEEVARFEAYWLLGKRERLAMDILLYAGLRRGDAARLGRQHVRDGVITIRTEKFGETITLPLLPPLAASIAATPTGDLTFIISDHGRPFTKESFGNWFADACRKAGCPGSAHGLRKASATRAANNGATTHELMAMFGWRSEKMAERYTRTADRQRLAAKGAVKLLPDQTQNEKRPHLQSGAGVSEEKATKTGA